MSGHPLNVLVCGGAGYIGAHMAAALAGHGHRVTVFDNCSTGHPEAVLWGELLRADLRAPADLERAFARGRYDAVMHFSAKSLVGESMADPAAYYENNVVGTLNLLDAMRRHGVDRFVFSSSAAAYGVPETERIAETHPTRPVNPYGRTKLDVEGILEAYAGAYGLRSVSLRYFNAAGADPGGRIGESHTPETHLIPNILRAALGETGALTIFGDDYPTRDGTCVRDYVHVADLCAAHLAALDAMERAPGAQVFNLGNGTGFTVKEILAAARQATGRDIPCTTAARRPGDPPALVADSAKARRELDWAPRYTDIGEIIATAWRWHRDKRY